MFIPPMAAKTIDNITIVDHDIEMVDALPTRIDVLNSFVPGWTVRGTWTSKIDARINGKFELRQNASNLYEFELRLEYSNRSSYAAGQIRAWMLDGAVKDNGTIAIQSKNFGSGQSLMIELHKSPGNNPMWVGNLTSILPADLVGLAGAVVSN